MIKLKTTVLYKNNSYIRYYYATPFWVEERNLVAVSNELSSELEKEYQKSLIPAKTPNPSEEKGSLTLKDMNDYYNRYLEDEYFFGFNTPRDFSYFLVHYLTNSVDKLWVENHLKLFYQLGSSQSKVFAYDFHKYLCNEILKANGETPEVDNPVPSLDKIKELIWNFGKDIWESEYGCDVGTWDKPEDTNMKEFFQQYIEEFLQNGRETDKEQPKYNLINWFEDLIEPDRSVDTDIVTPLSEEECTLRFMGSKLILRSDGTYTLIDTTGG